jgi:hypothetical protein
MLTGSVEGKLQLAALGLLLALCIRQVSFHVSQFKPFLVLVGLPSDSHSTTVPSESQMHAKPAKKLSTPA